MSYAGGVGFQLRQQRRRRSHVGRCAGRAFAGEGEACLHLRPMVTLVGKTEAEHDRLFSDRLRENLVIVGKLGEQRGINPRDVANNRARRQPVRLGEQDIECDGGRAHVGEPIDQLGNPVSRPGPLAKFAQRGLIDVDDPNRQILESPRRDALIFVEHRFADQLQRPRVAGPQDRECRHDAQADEHADLLGASHDEA